MIAPIVPTSPARAPARFTRPLGVALTVVSAIAIAWLTLRPAPAIGAMPFSRWCMLCGATGTADFLANIVLFVPLGVGLGLAGLPWIVATAVAVFCTGSIELAQYLVVPGRFATVGDIVANGTGGALGAAIAIHRRRWLHPSPRAATVLGALAGFGFLGTLAVSAWTLVLPVDPNPAPPSARPGAMMPGTGWFAGTVLRATVGDFVAANAAPGPLFVTAPARRTVVAEVEARHWSRGIETPSPILLVHGPDQGPERPWLVIAQRGLQFTLQAGDRGRRLGVRQPVMSIGARPFRGLRRAAMRRQFSDSVLNALRENGFEQSYTLRATISGNHVAFVYTRGPIELGTSVLRIAPSLGWALLSPLPTLESPLAGVATALWLAGLALPMGYCAWWAVQGRRLTRLVATTGLLSTVVAGLAVIPLAWGFSTGRWWEWVATLGGVAAGVAAAELARRIR